MDTRMRLALGIYLASFIGLIDALYLFSHYLSGEAITCGLSGGCNAVAASPYSVVFGIPLSAFGLCFYFGTIVLTSLEEWTLPALIAPYISFNFAQRLWSLVGIISSAYFTFLQAFVIHAWCQYCLLSAACTCFIFLCTWLRTRISA